jgi:hypothetical protein
VRPVVDLQHVFHGSHKRGVGLRRNNKLLLQVRFQRVFLASARSCSRWLWRQCSGPRPWSSKRLNVHRARPFGGSERVSAISLAFAAPSKMRFLAELGECLRVSTASKPSSTSCWRVRAIVARLVSSAFAIWLSLHPAPASPASAFNKMRALVSLCAGYLPLRSDVSSRSRSATLSVTTYFFTAIFVAVTNRLRRYVTEPSIRTIHSLSLTGGTWLGTELAVAPARSIAIPASGQRRMA